MNTALNSVGLLLMLLAACIVVMNYVYAIATYRNKRRGKDQHQSTVPLVAQILLALAAAVFFKAPNRWVQGSWLVAIALADISLWHLVAAPFMLLCRRK